ncbi:DUF4352 domain-containing protein [Fictibacillus sp. WQ 8-8]|uniref:DUF4352 domain-containing protein n=1 Tax=Fictibacillus sp. WQ 8-8 TaxID=2938788 RepID=UPI00210B7079|nr:DUF4352 domain-containing protein [Fictibacillus sp. WQ 8-8]MCQ6265610.1 DUF4352 domain-containing protein [Fictibacillus sp. WQ 8-8]
MGEKVKKPFYKKWWVWVIAVIVVIGFAGGGTGDDTASKDDSKKAETTSAEPKKEAPKKETKKEAPKKETKKEFKIGDSVKVGKMNYKVNKKQSLAQVGPSALPEKASGKFVVIEVSLKNNGDKAVTVDSSFFKLMRGKKTYEADTAASMSANQGEDGTIENSFFMQELNPDSTISGKVVFDVAPEVAAAGDLTLQVQTGAWGTETEKINLK